jgi:hypothetical protein
MTLNAFIDQMAECRVTVQHAGAITDVVIRTAHGDRDVAAVHRQGDRLIVDLGEEEVS